MTGPEQYESATGLLDEIDAMAVEVVLTVSDIIAAAQVRATLALAAATVGAGRSATDSEWERVLR